MHDTESHDIQINSLTMLWISFQEKSWLFFGHNVFSSIQPSRYHSAIMRKAESKKKKSSTPLLIFPILLTSAFPPSICSNLVSCKRAKPPILDPSLKDLLRFTCPCLWTFSLEIQSSEQAAQIMKPTFLAFPSQPGVGALQSQIFGGNQAEEDLLGIGCKGKGNGRTFFSQEILSLQSSDIKAD